MEAKIYHVDGICKNSPLGPRNDEFSSAPPLLELEQGLVAFAPDVVVVGQIFESLGLGRVQ